MTILFLLFPVPATGYETDRMPSIAVTMAPGQDERVLIGLLDVWRTGDIARVPRVIALEPGPIDLRHGLRILPNEVAPRFSPPPDLLIIAGDAPLSMDDLFLAYVRRCLLEGGRVWVVGPHFPEPLAEFPLTPGQTIERFSLEAFDTRLSMYLARFRERSTGGGAVRRMLRQGWWLL